MTALRMKAGVRGDSPTPSYGSVAGMSDDGCAITHIMPQLMASHSELNPLFEEISSISLEITRLTRDAVMATSGDRERRTTAKVNELVDTGKNHIVRIKQSTFPR